MADLEAQLQDLNFFLRTQEQVQDRPELAGGGLMTHQREQQGAAKGRRRRGSRRG